VCNDLNVTDIYVGHTTNFTHRKNGHKTSCCNINEKRHNLKVYQTIRENGGWENWSMIEIEKYPCSDENEAKQRERYWYEQLQPKLNSCCPIRTYEESLSLGRQRYNENKVARLERIKLYKRENSDKVKERAKRYREKNKEIIAVKAKLRYKNEISERRKNEKFNCDCGSICRESDKKIHLKTKKHQDFIKSITPVEQPETELPHSIS
jgi:hypothetical protein